MSKIGNKTYNLKKIGDQAFLIKVKDESAHQRYLQGMARDLVDIMIRCQANKTKKEGH